MDYIVTYRKNNGNIILRPRNSLSGMQIGDETSMGWTVLNIHYLYDGNYYTYLDYCKVVRGHQVRKQKKKRFIKYLIRQLNKMA